MSDTNPIIVVTGGNRGIGFEICRQLAERGVQVVLTARKPAAGQAALSKLGSQKLSAQFHPLEVADPASIAELRDFLEGTFGRLDVLINKRDVSQGADTATWLALDAPQDLTGKFLRDRKVIAW